MYKRKNFYLFFLISLVFVFKSSYADNHNIYEIIDLIQKDIKTLERAVYSENKSNEIDNQNVNS